MSDTKVIPESEHTGNFETIFSDPDIVRLFGQTSQGIDESGKNRSLLGARDHARLERLISLGLVQKTQQSKYSQTVMGNKLFLKQINDLRSTLLARASSRLLEYDGASNSGTNDTTVAKNLAQGLTEDLECVSGLMGLRPVHIFSDWLSLSMQTALLINNMKEELIVATRYMDFRTAETAVNSAKLGRKIRILHSNRKDSSTKLQLLGNLMSNPRAASAYREFLSNPNIQSREVEVPYSFIIVDQRSVEIEMINPRDPDVFFLAFYFESPLLAAKLMWLYNDMFRSSEEDKLGKNLEESQIKTSVVKEITR